MDSQQNLDTRLENVFSMLEQATRNSDRWRRFWFYLLLSCAGLTAAALIIGS